MVTDKEFDSSKYKLGILCKHNHQWRNTNQSLRYIKNRGWCVQCEKERYLRKRGPKVGEAWKITEAQKKEIVSKYESGESARAIARFYKFDVGSIIYVLKGRDCQMRSLSQACRKHSLNESVFDEITAASAYWIGFFFADGHVRKDIGSKGVLQVALSITDINHLEKLRVFFGATHKITLVKPHEMKSTKYITKAATSFTISSEKIVEKLIEYGMGNKSFGRIAPDCFKNSPDFWRGVVDGDGCIGIYRGYAHLNLAGGHELLSQFLAFAKQICPEITATVRNGNGCHQVCLGGKTAFEIIQRLYFEAETYLERKYQIATTIFAQGSSTKTRATGEKHHQAKLTEAQVWEIIALYNKGIGSTTLGRQFGVSKNTILRTIKGKSWKHLPRAH